MSTQAVNAPAAGSMGRFDLSVPRSRRQAVLWHMCGSSLISVLLIVQGLVLIPLYLQHLGDRLYGFWLASGGVLAWMGVLELGVTGIVMQRCAAAYGRRDYVEVGRYLRAGVVMVGVFAVIVVVVAFVVAGRVPGWLHVDEIWQPEVARAFLLAAVALALSLLNELARSFCLAVQRSPLTVFVEFCGTVLSIAVTVVALRRGVGLIALPLGFVVRAVFNIAINGSYTWLLARGTGTWRDVDGRIWHDFATIGPAAFSSRLVCGLTRQIEPLLITFFIRPELGVVFTVTLRALSAVEPFVNQINGSSAGAFAHLVGEGNTTALRRAVRQAATVLCAGSTIVGFGYCLGNAGFVALWVGGDRFGGQWLTAGLALASLSSLISRFFQMLVGAVGDQAFAGYISAAEAGLRLLAMCTLLAPMRLLAFPAATVLASVTVAALCWRRLDRVLPAVPKSVASLGAMPFWALGYIVVASACAPWIHGDSWGQWTARMAGAVGLFWLPLFLLRPVREAAAPILRKCGWR